MSYCLQCGQSSLHSHQPADVVRHFTSGSFLVGKMALHHIVDAEPHVNVWPNYGTQHETKARACGFFRRNENWSECDPVSRGLRLVASRRTSRRCSCFEITQLTSSHQCNVRLESRGASGQVSHVKHRKHVAQA